MFKEFREFAIKGSMIDMAVGIIIGGAFGSIVKSLVSDVVMPPIGLLLGNVDFSNLFIVLQKGAQNVGPYLSVADAQNAGAVTLNIGLFMNSVISFFIVAICVFILVRSINKLKNQIIPSSPATKTCPHCYSTIDIQATRCPQCTSSLTAKA